MKKIILLFAVALSVCVTSCQTDDDNAGPVETQDKFVGNWKITQALVNSKEELLSACDLQESLMVTSDQKFTWKTYELINGSCQLEDGETLGGTWENLGNNRYEITPELEVEDAVELKITFSANTFTIEYTDEDETFKYIYTKI